MCLGFLSDRRSAPQFGQKRKDGATSRSQLAQLTEAGMVSKGTTRNNSSRLVSPARARSKPSSCSSLIPSRRAILRISSGLEFTRIAARVCSLTWQQFDQVPNGRGSRCFSHSGQPPGINMVFAEIAECRSFSTAAPYTPARAWTSVRQFGQSLRTRRWAITATTEEAIRNDGTFRSSRPHDGRNAVVGMQRGENQMSGLCGGKCHFRGLLVANLRP